MSLLQKLGKAIVSDIVDVGKSMVDAGLKVPEKRLAKLSRDVEKKRLELQADFEKAFGEIDKPPAETVTIDVKVVDSADPTKKGKR